MTHKRKIQFSIAGYFIGAALSLALAPVAGLIVMLSAFVCLSILTANDYYGTNSALESIVKDVYDFFTGRSWLRRKTDKVLNTTHALLGTQSPSYFTTFMTSVANTLDSIKESVTDCYSKPTAKKSTK